MLIINFDLHNGYAKYLDNILMKRVIRFSWTFPHSLIILFDRNVTIGEQVSQLFGNIRDIEN